MVKTVWTVAMSPNGAHSSRMAVRTPVISHIPAGQLQLQPCRMSQPLRQQFSTTGRANCVSYFSSSTFHKVQCMISCMTHWNFIKLVPAGSLRTWLTTTRASKWYKLETLNALRCRMAWLSERNCHWWWVIGIPFHTQNKAGLYREETCCFSSKEEMWHTLLPQ